MPANKKPRKAYKPRYPTEDYNPIAAGVAASRVFTDEEAAERVSKVRFHIERAKMGQSGTNDWDAILFAWGTVKAMAGIPGVMENGKAAADLFGDVLLEMADRYQQGIKAMRPDERETFDQFMQLYDSLVYNVPLRIWADAERRTVIHRENTKRCIANEDAATA